MHLPKYYDEVPTLRVQDALARVLGAAVDGIFEYSFADAVRLTGHSCPNVAAAYWLTYLSLERLYPEGLPQRGAIRVDFREDARSGATGVMATVIQMLTGAAGGTGFKGIEGRFNRMNLVRYAPDLLLSMRFTRLDTREAVEANADFGVVPTDARLPSLLSRCVRNEATDAEQAQLASLWQERVRHLLLDHGRNPCVYFVRPAERGCSGIGLPRPRARLSPTQ